MKTAQSKIGSLKIIDLLISLFLAYVFFCLTSRSGSAVIEILGILTMFLPGFLIKLKYCFNSKISSFKILSILLGILLLNCLYHIFMSEIPLGSFSRIRHYIFLFVFGTNFIYELSMDKTTDFTSLFKKFLIAASLGILAGTFKNIFDVLSLIPKGSEFLWRYTSRHRFFSLTGVNSFSYCMAGLSAFFIMPVFKYRFEKKFSKFLIFIMVCTLFCLLMSKSRGPFLVIGLIAPFCTYFLSKKLSFLMGFISIGLLSLMIFLSITNTDPKEKTRLIQPQKSSSNMKRLSQYQAGWEVFKDYWVLGIGPRKFRDVIQDYKIKHNIIEKHYISHSHNTFLHISIEHGIIVGLLFIFLILSLFRNAREMIKNRIIRGMVYAAVSTFVLQSFWDHMYIRQYAVCCNILILMSWVVFIKSKKETTLL